MFLTVEIKFRLGLVYLNIVKTLLRIYVVGAYALSLPSLKGSGAKPPLHSHKSVNVNIALHGPASCIPLSMGPCALAMFSIEPIQESALDL
ncbi:hypothetical protein MRB53_015474 [Persea americana]|uniref:Uncharacterized protein n=1 Tax=Persea americana TaxID=3435 RepID=A0ACC2LZD7_PERAE|nr:hypothetical protein MRB53_015474 [Persea americana]